MENRLNAEGLSNCLTIGQSRQLLTKVGMVLLSFQSASVSSKVNDPTLKVLGTRGLQVLLQELHQKPQDRQSFYLFYRQDGGDS